MRAFCSRLLAIPMNDDVLKKKLNPEQYRVMRQKGTETAYSGLYWNMFERGTYRCAACAAELFSSKDKFDAQNGWPGFRKPIQEKKLEYKEEGGVEPKAEVRCATCKSHLGYVIGADQPHYVLNSVALQFEEALKIPEVREKIEKIQEVKEKFDEERSKNAQEKSDQSTILRDFSLLVLGIVGGAGALAVLTFAGTTSFICQAPAAPGLVVTSTAATSTIATTTPLVRQPLATTSAATSTGL